MILTERANVSMPRDTLAEARKRWPETRELPNGRLVRFMAAIALGKSRAEALAFTRDARIIDRPPMTS
jgi:hypothetical protein